MTDDDILFPLVGLFEEPLQASGEKDPDVVAEEEALRAAYNRVFTGRGSAPDGDAVVKHLYHICYGALTTFDPDPRIHAFKEGSRSVLLRILSLAGRNAAGR